MMGAVHPDHPRGDTSGDQGTPIPGLDAAVNDVRMRTAALVDTEILPHETSCSCPAGRASSTPTNGNGRGTAASSGARRSRSR